MNDDNKTWLETDDEKKKTEQSEENSGKSKSLNSEQVKEDEKRHGLVDEDHPFPSKGN